MIKIIENKSEIAAGTRGASLGIGAMKVVSQTLQDGFFGEFETINIANENQLLNFSTPYNFAKRIDGLVKIYNRTCNTISEVLSEKKFPLVLSGDHACAGGTIAGVKKAFPNKRLGVIWIDAHADIHTPYTTPSGNIHGMPLSTALNEDNLEAQINQLDDKTIKYWNDLKQTGGIAPKINVNDIIYISVRDTEKPEDDYLRRHQIKNYSVNEIRTKGRDNVLTEIQSKLENCDIIYVSFDVDSMDCILVSKGTGTPVENGLSPDEANFFLTEFAKWNKTACIEFVEINPCLDDKINKMAETAYSILKKTAEGIKSRFK
ncbi:MAG TPA: arginase [Crocinitomix sp.]|nr:arginase [Crocinitomix sp.]